MSSMTLAPDACTDPRCIERVEQLEAALVHRDVIATVNGLLMAALDCSADAAFEVMRAESQGTNVKIWVVAETYVAEHRHRLGLPAR